MSINFLLYFINVFIKILNGKVWNNITKAIATFYAATKSETLKTK